MTDKEKTEEVKPIADMIQTLHVMRYQIAHQGNVFEFSFTPTLNIETIKEAVVFMLDGIEGTIKEAKELKEEKESESKEPESAE